MISLNELKDALDAAYPCDWLVMDSDILEARITSDLRIRVFLEQDAVGVHAFFMLTSVTETSNDVHSVVEFVRKVLIAAFVQALGQLREDDFWLFANAVLFTNDWVRAIAHASLSDHSRKQMVKCADQCFKTAHRLRLEASDVQWKHDSIQKFLAADKIEDFKPHEVKEIKAHLLEEIKARLLEDIKARLDEAFARDWILSKPNLVWASPSTDLEILVTLTESTINVQVISLWGVYAETVGKVEDVAACVRKILSKTLTKNLSLLGDDERAEFARSVNYLEKWARDIAYANLREEDRPCLEESIRWFSENQEYCDKEREKIWVRLRAVHAQLRVEREKGLEEKAERLAKDLEHLRHKSEEAKEKKVDLQKLFGRGQV